MSPSGTMVAGVIGWPVAHSRSPAIHAAAARATGAPLVYGTFPVRPGETDAALEAVRALGIKGLSVTMPHKEAVISGLDAMSDAATALDAVNCVINTDGQLHGENTDGAGFLHGLREAAGIDVAGRSIGVLGAGGAARAVIHACAHNGASSVTVVNRSAERAESATLLAPGIGRVGDHSSLGAVDIVVNATSVGMAETEAAGELVCSVERLADHAVVVDIVYNPSETPLLVAARTRGLQTVGGLPMLVGQAALQFQLWTGQTPPFAPLLEAALTQK